MINTGSGGWSRAFSSKGISRSPQSGLSSHLGARFTGVSTRAAATNMRFRSARWIEFRLSANKQRPSAGVRRLAHQDVRMHLQDAGADLIAAELAGDTPGGEDSDD